MNDDKDLIMRQIKSFAQGLGAVLGKSGRKPDEPVVVFHDAEVSLANYKKTLATLMHKKGMEAAQAQLLDWQHTRLSARQYQALQTWLHDQRFLDQDAGQ